MSHTLYPDYRSSVDSAYHAADLLIAALHALNATDSTYPNRDVVSALAVQEPGSAFQCTMDALKATIRVLTSHMDPEAEFLESAMDVMHDVMGENGPSRTIVRHVRSLVDEKKSIERDEREVPAETFRGQAVYANGFPGTVRYVYGDGSVTVAMHMFGRTQIRTFASTRDLCPASTYDQGMHVFVGVAMVWER